jgi:hypothetical protein
VGAKILVIDATNIGKGLSDQLNELSELNVLKARVVRIYFYDKEGVSPEYYRILDEIQFLMRRGFDPTNPLSVMIDPDDVDLAEQLPKRGWKILAEDSTIKVQRKGELDSSPDRADAVSLLFAKTDDGFWFL